MADKEELLSGINFISQETLDGISETDDSKLYLMEKTVLDNGDTLDFQVQYPLALNTTSNPNIVNAVYNTTDCLGTYNNNNRNNTRYVSSPYTVTINQGSFSVGDIATWELSSYVDIPFNYKTDILYAQKGLHSAALGYMNGENKFVPLFFIVGTSNTSTVGDIVHVSSPSRRSSTTMDVENLGSESNYSSSFYSSSFSYYQFYTDGETVYARSENTSGVYVRYRVLSSSALADLERVTTIRIAGIQYNSSQPTYTEQGVFRWPYDSIICETEWQTPEGLGLTRVYPPNFTPATVLSCEQDYNNLKNIPRLNGIPLAGDLSFEAVDLQKNLTVNLPLVKSGILHDTYVGFTVESNIGSSSTNTYKRANTAIIGSEKVGDTLIRPVANTVILPYSFGQTVFGANFTYVYMTFGKLNEDGTFLPIVKYGNGVSNIVSLGDYDATTHSITCSVTGGLSAQYTSRCIQLQYTDNSSIRARCDTGNSSGTENVSNTTLTYTWPDASRNYGDINAVLITPNYASFTNWDMTSVGVYSVNGSYGIDFYQDGLTPDNKVAGIDTENSVQYLDVKIDNQTIQLNSNGELSANLDEIGSDIVDINSALGGFAFKSMTQTEYEALATKDATTLYITTGTTPGLYFGSVVIVQGAA